MTPHTIAAIDEIRAHVKALRMILFPTTGVSAPLSAMDAITRVERELTLVVLEREPPAPVGASAGAYESPVVKGGAERGEAIEKMDAYIRATEAALDKARAGTNPFVAAMDKHLAEQEAALSSKDAQVSERRSQLTKVRSRMTETAEDEKDR